MSIRLGGYLKDLASSPPHTAAPAMADLTHALESALAQYPNSPALGQYPNSPAQGSHPSSPASGLHTDSSGLQGLCVGLVQQALAQLMDKAAACVAALPVMGPSECQTPYELRKLLLTVLGQVCPA